MANFGNIANRLYRGEANLNIVGKRKLWFGVAGGIVAVSLLALIIFGFKPGIEFSGGNEFQVPIKVGTPGPGRAGGDRRGPRRRCPRRRSRPVSRSVTVRARSTRCAPRPCPKPSSPR